MEKKKAPAARALVSKIIFFIKNGFITLKIAFYGEKKSACGARTGLKSKIHNQQLFFCLTKTSFWVFMHALFFFQIQPLVCTKTKTNTTTPQTKNRGDFVSGSFHTPSSFTWKGCRIVWHFCSRRVMTFHRRRRS